MSDVPFFELLHAFASKSASAYVSRKLFSYHDAICLFPQRMYYDYRIIFASSFLLATRMRRIRF